MNKKIIFGSLIAATLLTGVSFKNNSQATFSEGTINFDVDVIKALSHKNGEVVNFVNNDLVKYWDSAATDYDNLKTLYEMNSEIESFPKNSYNAQYVRELYAKWDDFKPVNNKLQWVSNVRTNTYDVVVSLNPTLTEAVYEEKGLTETSFVLDNPYANTHYFWQVTAHTDEGEVKSTIFDFYSADYKRTIDIPAVSNTRDVGGFTGKYGEMKQGLIYRSARLDDIEEEGVIALYNLGIQTDLDLRGKGEGAINPAGLPNYFLRSIPGSGYSLAFTEANRSMTVEAMRVFADPNNYPVIFHCAVGRDRTGTLGMLLQALCGASKEYIVHDYYTSVFSVTGAYSKALDNLNLNAVEETLASFTNGGKLSLVEGAEQFLKVRKDAITGNDVGLSNEEIQSIRDIWSGKTPVLNAPKPFEASENYHGKAFVTIKALGHKDVAYMVEKGTVISSPYTLNEGYGWFVDGENFDFTSPINDTTCIYADYLLKYSIVIHFVGMAKKDITLKAQYGDVITFEAYFEDGYEAMILLDNGKVISRFNVIRDAYINIIYIKE